MKTSRVICVAILLLLTGGAALVWWKKGEPRRASIQVLQSLNQVLAAQQKDGLLELLVLPESVQGRTTQEQAEFTTKALQDEISHEGLTALKREGSFGPLTILFPTEAEIWAKQAGVASENCVAFRMGKNGWRAEVMLLSTQSGYRIVRCNNVKQMADTKT